MIVDLKKDAEHFAKKTDLNFDTDEVNEFAEKVIILIAKVDNWSARVGDVHRAANEAFDK